MWQDRALSVLRKTKLDGDLNILWFASALFGDKERAGINKCGSSFMCSSQSLVIGGFVEEPYIYPSFCSHNCLIPLLSIQSADYCSAIKTGKGMIHRGLNLGKLYLNLQFIAA